MKPTPLHTLALLSLGLAAAAAAHAQTTVTFNGGSIGLAGNWTGGLPTIADNRTGVINVDGTFNTNTPGWSVTQNGGTLSLNGNRTLESGSVWTMNGGSIVSPTAGQHEFRLNTGSVLNLNAGSISNVGAFRIQAAGDIFNQSGGSINAVADSLSGNLIGGTIGSQYNMTGGTASFVSLALNSTELNFSGGSFTFTNLGATANTISRLTVGGTANITINSASAIDVTRFTTTGNNWLSTGTGASLTVQGWGYGDFESLFTSNRFRYDGATLNATQFGELFQVTGSTLSLIPEPSSYAALLGLATLGLAAARRRR